MLNLTLKIKNEKLKKPDARSVARAFCAKRGLYPYYEIFTRCYLIKYNVTRLLLLRNSLMLNILGLLPSLSSFLFFSLNHLSFSFTFVYYVY